jgi:membrane-associated protease RseP (regulator of RpoE activity)
MKILRILFASFALTIIIMAHELGHWVEMSRNGVEVEEVGLGMAFGLPHLSFASDSFPGTTFTLNPLPFGAFVKESKEGRKYSESLPYRSQAMINGAGAWVNVLTGILFTFAKVWSDQKMDKDKRRRWIAGSVLVFALVYLGKEFLCRIGIILFWPIGIAFVVGLLLKRKRRGESALSAFLSGSVIWIIDEAQKIVFTRKAIGFAAIICYGLAFMNALPIPPLDGGRTAEVALGKFLPKAVVMGYSVTSMFAIMAIAFSTFFGDVHARVKAKRGS